MSEVRGFHVSGNGAQDLVETCINDLRMHGNGRNVHCIDAEAGGMSQTRREAVIILYASGAIGVFEGWNVKHDDVPELLAAKVLRDG